MPTFLADVDYIISQGVVLNFIRLIFYCEWKTVPVNSMKWGLLILLGVLLRSLADNTGWHAKIQQGITWSADIFNNNLGASLDSRHI